MTKNETITINETITQRFQSHLYNCIKESNIPAMQLSVSFDREKAYIKDEKAGRIVGEVDMKITIERYEPKKMTRSEVEKAIVAYCDPVATPCKECKCFKICNVISLCMCVINCILCDNCRILRSLKWTSKTYIPYVH